MDELLELLPVAFRHLWETDCLFRVSVVVLPVAYLYLGWRFLALEDEK